VDVVKRAAMKISNGSVRPRQARISPTQRARLLAQFERSGLSAAAFARQHRLHYTTFCGWRQRQGKAAPSPGFVQVELPPPAPAALVIEWGDLARMHLTSLGQIPLAARLLQMLNRSAPC
jgi:transposase-like protein